MARATLSEIIDDVTGDERTLTVYDPASRKAVAAVREHFDVQSVSVETASASGGPTNFAVLHDGGEFLAAADLERLRRVVTFETGLVDADSFAETQVPDVLTHVDETTFTAYGKQRMILASREIEERGWRASGGELHAGFQRLSLLGDQWDLYERLGERDVDVHVYGAPDWRPPARDWLTVHAGDAPEIIESWFVVFDAPDGGHCGLLAEERAPNEYAGFWTYDDALVGDILGRLRSTYA